MHLERNALKHYLWDFYWFTFIWELSWTNPTIDSDETTTNRASNKSIHNVLFDNNWVQSEYPSSSLTFINKHTKFSFIEHAAAYPTSQLIQQTLVLIFFENLHFVLESTLQILAESYNSLICVYVAIGQKQATIAYMFGVLQSYNSMKNLILLTSTAASSAAEQYLAPYSGTAIGELYRNFGLNSLIIYDDLSKHAVAYRQMSLLLRRPPGREAYPGDIFYLHSRLLERSAKLSEERSSGGSITSFPIIETQAGDLAGYIPTNVISITDGQIFLSKELFLTGFIPAIDVGLSVSRVGSTTQPGALKKIAGKLKLLLSQFYDVENLAQLDYELDASMQLIITRGSQILSILKQAQYKPVSVNIQILAIFLVNNGYLDAIPTTKNLNGLNYSYHLYKVLNLLYKNTPKKITEYTKQIFITCPQYILSKYAYGFWKTLQLLTFYILNKKDNVVLTWNQFYNTKMMTTSFNLVYKFTFEGLFVTINQ